MISKYVADHIRRALLLIPKATYKKMGIAEPDVKFLTGSLAIDISVLVNCLYSGLQNMGSKSGWLK